MKFKTKNQVRMHDTDMAGILYFPRQFRFIHDAWEDMMEHEGLSFEILFTENDFVFVVAHVEADYLAPLHVGDKLEIAVQCAHIGNTSFQMRYEIYKVDGTLVGTGKTVHVCLKRVERTKIPVPEVLRKMLSKYLKKD